MRFLKIHIAFPRIAIKSPYALMAFPRLHTCVSNSGGPDWDSMRILEIPMAFHWDSDRIPTGCNEAGPCVARGQARWSLREPGRGSGGFLFRICMIALLPLFHPRRSVGESPTCKLFFLPLAHTEWSVPPFPAPSNWWQGMCSAETRHAARIGCS